MLRLKGVPFLIGVVLMAFGLLNGCESPESSNHNRARGTAVEAPAPQNIFRSRDYRVALAYPENGVQASDDSTGYFDNHGWRVGAGPNDAGERLLSLRLDGSNQVTTGELRLGASRAHKALSTCTRPVGLGNAKKAGHTSLAGVRFTEFKGGDAAMSHYQDVHALRAVHDGICYAIDLVVEGTNPKVYDPPRTPPFSRAQAFHRLRTLLAGLSFDANH